MSELSLEEKFPTLFTKCISSSFPAGWKRPVELACQLLEELGAYYDSDADKVGSSIHIIQVKEKFGGLRLYTDCDNEEDRQLVNHIVSLTEMACAGRCENCASVNGENFTHASGWIRTLCEKCSQVQE